MIYFTFSVKDGKTYCMVNAGKQPADGMDNLPVIQNLAYQIDSIHSGEWSLCEWVVTKDGETYEQPNPHVNQSGEAVYLFRKVNG